MTKATSRRQARRALLGASALSTLLMLPGLAAAQQDNTAIEEIIVTATKRDATIQDIPFSINAQTEKDIQRSGAVTLEDLSRNVAGLTIQNLGPGQCIWGQHSQLLTFEIDTLQKKLSRDCLQSGKVAVSVLTGKLRA